MSARFQENKVLRIAVTPGEPAGIGPDILIQHIQQKSASPAAQIVAIASPSLLQERAALLGLPLKLTDFDANVSARANEQGELFVLPVELAATCKPGMLDKSNASYVLQTLTLATQHCLNNTFAAVVTGPVQKSIINEAGVAFSGHTEFFAEQSSTSRVVMMLATEGLRVALATTHLPLKDVSVVITQTSLSEILAILLNDLKTKFGLREPRILVCGLNPHAGEGGHLGMEEIETINPVLDTFRKQGHQLIGPLPADTLFTPKVLHGADAVLAMYHDQGLPVLKYKGFGNAVNITLGLPFIRTSVDHGTALDLAGTGKADAGSLRTAIHYALDMVSSVHAA